MVPETLSICMFLNPPCSNNCCIKAGFAQRNMPGAPAGDGGISIYFDNTFNMVVYQSLFSGPSQTETATLPSGRQTRNISFAARAISGKNIKPILQLILSKKLSWNGRFETSVTVNSIL